MIKRYFPDRKKKKKKQVLLNSDGSAFVIDSPTATPVGLLTMQRLSSLDFGLYLVNTVKFRLGHRTALRI